MNIKSKITDELKEDILLLLKQERNPVVKERLTYISMYINGITKRDIANMVGRTKETVGTWINKYFKGGIDAIVICQPYIIQIIKYSKQLFHNVTLFVLQTQQVINSH